MSGRSWADADRFGVVETARIESDRTCPADLDRIQDVFEKHRETQSRTAGISEPEIPHAASVQGHETEPHGKGIQTFSLSAVRQDRACAKRTWPYYGDLQTVREIV